MAEYYAVERSQEYLAHYGIKGMRWGVRKAREMGGSRGAKRLAKHYAKAQKKLAKLNARADINKQSAIAKKYGKIAKISGGIGISAALSSVGAHHLQNKNWKKFDSKADTLYNKLNPSKFEKNPSGATKIIDMRSGAQHWSLNDKSRQNFVINNPEAKKLYTAHAKTNNNLNNAKYITGGIGAAGLAVGAATGIKAFAAKRRTTAPGHAAAVARRDEFKREMDKAFKGVKIKQTKSKPSHLKEDIKDGLRSAALSTVMGPAASFYVQSKRAVADTPRKKKRK